MQENYRIAIEHSEKTAQRNKQRYDLKVRESILEEGDRVLVKNVSIRGKHKIADRWSSTVYKVVKHIADSPVYVVAPATLDGPERTLHRDLLLPCGFLAPSIQDEVDQEKEKRGKAQTPQEDKSPQEEGEPEQQCEIEEEVEYYYPQTIQENITFPTITIVHEIPQAQVNPTREDDQDGMSIEKSNLNPDADTFQPMGNLEGKSHEEREGNSPVETNSPAEGNSPLEDNPRVEDDIVHDESGRESTVETNEGNIEEKNYANMEEVILEEESEVEEQDENQSTAVENNPVREETENSEVRRSTRQRVEPSRLQYNTLGNPFSFVMHSILNSLDQVFTQALDFTLTPDISHLTPM